MDLSIFYLLTVALYRMMSMHVMYRMIVSLFVLPPSHDAMCEPLWIGQLCIKWLIRQ